MRAAAAVVGGSLGLFHNEVKFLLCCFAAAIL